MARYFYILLALFFFFRANGQNKHDSDFALIYVSNNVTYDTKKLSKEVSLQKTLGDVKKLIAKKIQETDSKVTVIFTRDGSPWRWERNIGSSTEGTENEWIIFGKRGIDELTVYHQNDFQTFFKDVVVLLDTIYVQVRFNSDVFDFNHFRLRFYCPDSIASLAIPVTSSRMLIFPTGMLSPDCRPGHANRVLLYNTGSPLVALADFQLLSPDSGLLSEWLEIARGLKRNEPSLSLDTIGQYLQAYISDNYGACGVRQINHWLSNNL